jgi:hypothetical protein
MKPSHRKAALGARASRRPRCADSRAGRGRDVRAPRAPIERVHSIDSGFLQCLALCRALVGTAHPGAMNLELASSIQAADAYSALAVAGL